MSNQKTGRALAAQLRIEDPERELEDGAGWLRSYLQDTDQERLVVCLSGGIDSATTALWATRSVGSDRVILLSLPYGVEASGAERPADDREVVDLAWAVAGSIEEAADLRVLDIAPTVDREAADSGLLEAIERNDEGRAARIWFGNLKARIRGVRARTVANHENALVLGTENRSEYLLGYFTVDGDEQSDLGLLRAYFKTEVQQLAETVGVPEEILQRPPSAGLWRGQEDEEELGFSYRQADRVLVRLFGREGGAAGRLTPDQRRAATQVPDVSPSTAQEVLERVEATAFKRRPTPHFRRRPRSGGSRSLREKASGRDDPGKAAPLPPPSESQRRRLERLRARGDDASSDQSDHHR